MNRHLIYASSQADNGHQPCGLPNRPHAPVYARHGRELMGCNSSEWKTPLIY